jgi:hypothetical protein
MTYQQMHVYEYFQSAFRILYGYSLQLARMAYFELEKYRNRIPETCVGDSMFLITDDFLRFPVLITSPYDVRP